MCNFVRFILGDSFLFSRVVQSMSVIPLILKEYSDGQLFVHATDLRDRSTVSLSSRNNPIDICLVTTNFVNSKLTFLAQSFVFRDRQKETTAIASILQGAN